MENKLPDNIPYASEDLPGDVPCIWREEDIKNLIKRYLAGEFDDYLS